MQIFKASVVLFVALMSTVFAIPLNPQPLPPGIMVDPECNQLILLATPDV
jgi:hypothetical protein